MKTPTTLLATRFFTRSLLLAGSLIWPVSILAQVTPATMEEVFSEPEATSGLPYAIAVVHTNQLAALWGHLFERGHPEAPDRKGILSDIPLLLLMSDAKPANESEGDYLSRLSSVLRGSPFRSHKALAVYQPVNGRRSYDSSLSFEVPWLSQLREPDSDRWLGGEVFVFGRGGMPVGSYGINNYPETNFSTVRAALTSRTPSAATVSGLGLVINRTMNGALFGIIDPERRIRPLLSIPPSQRLVERLDARTSSGSSALRLLSNEIGFGADKRRPVPDLQLPFNCKVQGGESTFDAARRCYCTLNVTGTSDGYYIKPDTLEVVCPK